MFSMMCSVQLAVTLHSPASGRYMDLYTNMPGLQFYSGNNLNGSTVGKGAYPYPIYGGLALETQVGYLHCAPLALPCVLGLAHLVWWSTEHHI